MTTSQEQITEALSEDTLGKFWLGYFQERFRGDIHDKLLELASELKNKRGITGAYIAKRLSKRPEQISRWLGASTNLESDTISDLALAMGYFPTIQFQSIKSAMTGGAPNDIHIMSIICRNAKVTDTSDYKSILKPKSNHYLKVSTMVYEDA